MSNSSIPAVGNFYSKENLKCPLYENKYARLVYQAYLIYLPLQYDTTYIALSLATRLYSDFTLLYINACSYTR